MAEAYVESVSSLHVASHVAEMMCTQRSPPCDGDPSTRVAVMEVKRGGRVREAVWRNWEVRQVAEVRWDVSVIH